MNHKQQYPEWLDVALSPDGYRIKIKSITDFMKIFHSEEKCLEYLANLKWGQNGWQCRKCFNNAYSFITTRKQVKCNRCGYYESFIANTIMHKSRKHLPEWFWVIYTIATNKMGISATEVYRQLGFGHY